MPGQKRNRRTLRQSRSPRRSKVIKSPRRPPASHLLIIECDAEKLARQQLDMGSKLFSLLRVLFPEKQIVLVKSSSLAELNRSLADTLVSHDRFRTILVVGHSNEKGLQLTSGNGFDWKAIAGWLDPFNPEFLLLAACRAGRFAAARDLFSEIKSLRQIYASPVTFFRDQSDPLAALIIALFGNRKIDDGFFRLLQAAGYMVKDGVMFRWKRGEVTRGSSLKGIGWDLVGDLVNRRI
jgi:hypothetical protein